MAGGSPIGLAAEFDAGERATRAVRGMRERGYRSLDLHAGCELRGAAEALGLERPRGLPRLVLAAGLLGAALAYAVQWYTNSLDYPLVVGGRPLHPLPAFVPITFEGGVLLASLAAFGGLIARARLLRLWRPEFELPGFERATVDRYWLTVGAGDPRFDGERTRRELEAFSPLRVERIEAGP